MYVTLYLDQHSYEFNVSLHSTHEAADAAIADLLQRFDIKNTTNSAGEPDAGLPPQGKVGRAF